MFIICDENVKSTNVAAHVEYFMYLTELYKIVIKIKNTKKIRMAFVFINQDPTIV